MKLNPLQRLFLNWLSEGRTYEEIAIIEDFPPAKVDEEIEVLLKTLDVEGIEEALAASAPLGLI